MLRAGWEGATGAGRRLLIGFSYCTFRPVNRKPICSVREGHAGLDARPRSGVLELAGNSAEKNRVVLGQEQFAEVSWCCYDWQPFDLVLAI
jgi:hypothetical protein